MKSILWGFVPVVPMLLFAGLAWYGWSRIESADLKTATSAVFLGILYAVEVISLRIDRLRDKVDRTEQRLVEFTSALRLRDAIKEKG